MKLKEKKQRLQNLAVHLVPAVIRKTPLAVHLVLAVPLEPHIYHADAHAGNIIVDGTSFKLIDAGRIADLNAKERENVQTLEFAINYLEKLSKEFTKDDELKLVQVFFCIPARSASMTKVEAIAI